MSKIDDIRTIIVFVKDKQNRPLHGPKIDFFSNGVFFGTVANAEGRASINIEKNTEVEVQAEYESIKQSAKLAPDQDTWVFVFPTGTEEKERHMVERHIPLISGFIMFGVALFLAFSFSTTNTLQTRLLLAVAALGGGLIATEIPGMLQIDVKFGTKLVIGATGALGVFVLLYMVAPN